jgi:hypothetical protein
MSQRRVDIIFSVEDITALGTASAAKNISKTINQIEAEQKASAARQIAARQKEAEKFASLSGVKKLKAQFGEESDFGAAAKIIKGGGAIAGIAAAGEVLKNITGGVAQIADGMREGNMSGIEMADTFAKMIPIVGEIGVNIDEAISGRRAKERMNEAATVYRDGLQEIREQAILTTKTIGLHGIGGEQTAARLSQEAEIKKLRNKFASERQHLEGRGLTNAQSDLDETIQALRERGGAQDKEFLRRDQQEKLEMTTAHSLRISGIQTERRATQLQLAGQAAAAEKAILDEKFKQEVAAAKQAADQLKLNRPQDAVLIDNNLRAQVGQLKLKKMDDEAAIERHGNEQRLAEAHAWRDRREALEVAADSADLRARGLNYRAQVAELRAAKEHELAVIQDNLRQKLAAADADPDKERGKNSAATAKQHAKTETALVNRKADADDAIAKEAESFRLADKAFDLETRRNQLKLDGATQLAAAGDIAAQREADRLQITEAIRQKQKDIAVQLRDKSLTDDQRSQLEGMSRELGAQGAAALALQRFKDTDPRSIGRPTLSSGRFIDAGLAGDARFRQPQDLLQLVKAAKEQFEVQTRISDGIQKLANLPYAPIFAAGYGAGS